MWHPQGHMAIDCLNRKELQSRVEDGMPKLFVQGWVFSMILQYIQNILHVASSIPKFLTHYLEF